MNQEHFNLETPDGDMTTYACWPDGDGPFPAVVFYMDAPGIRQELYDMAQRIAADGYYVILPDLFYRFGLLRFPFRSQKTQFIWREAMRHLTNADVVSDTKVMLDYMAQQPQVKDGPKATIGYCMSGRFVTAVAGEIPDVFAANASLYGVAIVTSQEDSSHFHVKDIKGEMYYGFAEHDGSVPAYVIPTLKSELDVHGVDYTLEVHPGTEHGFCFKSRACYDDAAAEKVHAHFMDMLKRKLG
jgi:carboxymethylenebutenolidase